MNRNDNKETMSNENNTNDNNNNEDGCSSAYCCCRRVTKTTTGTQNKKNIVLPNDWSPTKKNEKEIYNTKSKIQKSVDTVIPKQIEKAKKRFKIREETIPEEETTDYEEVINLSDLYGLNDEVHELSINSKVDSAKKDTVPEKKRLEREKKTNKLEDPIGSNSCMRPQTGNNEYKDSKRNQVIIEIYHEPSSHAVVIEEPQKQAMQISDTSKVNMLVLSNGGDDSASGTRETDVDICTCCNNKNNGVSCMLKPNISIDSLEKYRKKAVKTTMERSTTTDTDASMLQQTKHVQRKISRSNMEKTRSKSLDGEEKSNKATGKSGSGGGNTQKLKINFTSTHSFKQRQLDLHNRRVQVEEKRIELLELKMAREREEMLREQKLFEKELEVKTALLTSITEHKVKL